MTPHQSGPVDADAGADRQREESQIAALRRADRDPTMLLV